jgi:SAM-dependent methyltransferase
MSSSANKPFDRPGVVDYEKRRYRGLDQRLVDLRERAILRRFLERAVGEKPAGPPSSAVPPLVLDAPCGYGRFSGLLLDAGARLVSSDLAQAMVARALENTPDSRHIGGAVSDFRRGLPFKPGSIDYVFSMRLFHHLHEVEDRAAVLREFFRVAKSGVILSFYKVRGVHALQRRVRRFLKKARREIKMVPGAAFEREVREAGFTIECIVPLFRGVHAQHIVFLRK